MNQFYLIYKVFASSTVFGVNNDAEIYNRRFVLCARLEKNLISYNKVKKKQKLTGCF